MDTQIDPITSPAPGPGQDLPAKKRHGCFYYGCLSTVVFVIAAAAGFYFLYQYGKKTVTPVVEEFLTAAEGGNYDRAYAMVANEWKQHVTRDDFPALFKTVHEQLGARQSLSM